MRRILPCVALAIALGSPCAAETVLYATAASQSRIDGFKVNADGSLDGAAFEHQPTKSASPRRLVVRSCRLYVAETDRIEVFRIGPRGHLESLGNTLPLKGSNPHDMDLSPDGKTLYFPMRSQGALISFPLDDNGVPVPLNDDQNATGSTGYFSRLDGADPQPTCVFAHGAGAWEDIEVTATNLYGAQFDRVMTFGLDGSGRILGAIPTIEDPKNPDQETCENYRLATASPISCWERDINGTIIDADRDCWTSVRFRLSGATSLALISGAQQTLVMNTQFDRRLLGFTLDATGNFKDFGNTESKERKKARKQERKSNRTNPQIRYIGITPYQPPPSATCRKKNNKPVLECPAIFATGYQGRTDSYQLNDGILTRNTTGQTSRDPTSSPTRSTVGFDGQGRPKLYVAGGERDRIQVFRLSSLGRIADGEGPMMESDEQAGSFPNDVVLVDITNCD